MSPLNAHSMPARREAGAGAEQGLVHGRLLGVGQAQQRDRDPGDHHQEHHRRNVGETGLAAHHGTLLTLTPTVSGTDSPLSLSVSCSWT